MTHSFTQYRVSSKSHISLCPYHRAQLEMKVKSKKHKIFGDSAMETT